MLLQLFKSNAPSEEEEEEDEEEEGEEEEEETWIICVLTAFRIKVIILN